MKKRVYIVMGSQGYNNMFAANGYDIAMTPDEADLICFTGGEDVSPMLYEMPKHPSTHCNPVRDQSESDLYHNYYNTPMVGICRGSQFLNVMCGGSLWQNVNNHATGRTHDALDILTGEVFEVTSTHHQMMIPGDEGKLLLTADLSTVREDGIVVDRGEGYEDVECVFYEFDKVLCFQPHPEYVGVDHPMQRWFFNTLEETILS